MKDNVDFNLARADQLRPRRECPPMTDPDITTRYREARIIASLLPSPLYLTDEARHAVMSFVEAVQLAERGIHQRERPRPVPAKTSFGR